MPSLRKFAFAAAVALGVAASDTPARANPTGCNGPFCNNPRYPTLSSLVFGHNTRQPLPTFQAAPWYLYWPYDGHFQTIAPMAHGLYYPPPTYTGNPYLPGAYPGYLPGNPAPAFPVAPARP